ncbi:hypothetical protein [Spiribacter vilamensis]|nr:hypothetical protein [Spiribacter vilamensis]TVO62046.1 hypothetical protein FPL09_08115 [Spiribacter vilamensis]
MRSRLGAVGMVALGALMPLLFWLSGGLLALITLRRGVAESGIVLVGATALLLPIHAVLLGTPLAVLQPLALVWLPVMGMAWILRTTLSLALTVQVGAIVAVAAVAIFHAIHGDPTLFWTQTLEAVSDRLLAAPPGAGWDQAVEQLAPRLTGLWATNVLAVAVLCLLLGRFWQAMLYNPGGFRSEFHELRFALWFAAGAGAAVIAGMIGGPGLVADLGVILGAVFILQAVAIAHAVVARRGWHKGWLVGFYLVLPLLLRPAVLVGLADTFMDFRARLARGT